MAGFGYIINATPRPLVAEGSFGVSRPGNSAPKDERIATIGEHAAQRTAPARRGCSPLPPDGQRIRTAGRSGLTESSVERRQRQVPRQGDFEIGCIVNGGFVTSGQIQNGRRIVLVVGPDVDFAQIGQRRPSIFGTEASTRFIMRRQRG